MPVILSQLNHQLNKLGSNLSNTVKIAQQICSDYLKKSLVRVHEQQQDLIPFKQRIEVQTLFLKNRNSGLKFPQGYTGFKGEVSISGQVFSPCGSSTEKSSLVCDVCPQGRIQNSEQVGEDAHCDVLCSTFRPCMVFPQASLKKLSSF